MVRARWRRQSPIVRLLSPLRDFLAAEAAGAILLAAGAVIALCWVNSPWSGSYETLWTSHASITVTGHTLDLGFRDWVNDGLMTVFFFVVGLEIKRELTGGHLASRRSAMLPLVAAVGGMVVPALIYLSIAGTTESRGWAIPMATDIALAVGLVAALGKRVPTSLRAFLLGLAIVDDIGAIVVIAVFYSDGVLLGWLVVAIAGIGATLLGRALGIQSTFVYVVIGAFVWFGLHEAGTHPTLAGIVMGLLAPTTPRYRPELIDSDELTDLSNVDEAKTTTELAKGSVSVVEWLQHVLHPWTSFLIIPLFALANAGIVISLDGLRAGVGSPITWGIFVGLVLGKPIGIVLATRFAVRSGVGENPENAHPQQIVGVGAAAGIGFTVSLFITELAFTDPARETQAKLAILLASIVAALVATFILVIRGRERIGTHAE